MNTLNNPVEILKLLDKSNCRECGEGSCLAFAAAVFNGRLSLEGCPRLDAETLKRYGGGTARRSDVEAERDAAVQGLQRKVAAIDLAAAARRLGANFDGRRLTLKVLGKDFSVDTQGRLSSDIHVHAWIAGPFLHYILDGAGRAPSGQWVPLRELPNGTTWYRLFGQRCEQPLKRVADAYTDLFEDMIHIFNGRQVANHYQADISLVLEPLPRVPLLVCYWKPDEGLGSSLNLFFDRTAEENLPIEALFALGTGLVRMFEKIAQRHGLH